MSIKRIRSGARMSQAVVHDGVVYLSGQVAPADAGASVGAQTKAVLEQIDRLLADAGTTKEHLLTASIWLADMQAFDEMNAVWDRWIAPGCAPARAAVEARLASPAWQVEIAVTAALP